MSAGIRITWKCYWQGNHSQHAVRKKPPVLALFSDDLLVVERALHWEKSANFGEKLHVYHSSTSQTCFLHFTTVFFSLFFLRGSVFYFAYLPPLSVAILPSLSGDKRLNENDMEWEVRPFLSISSAISAHSPGFWGDHRLIVVVHNKSQLPASMFTVKLGCLFVQILR